MEVYQRFNKFVTKNDNGCWLWTGAIQGTYGVFHHEGRQKLAHRMSFQLFNKPPGPGLVIRHKCKSKTCINPEHLEEGTLKENSADRLRDGTDCRGERNPCNKLTCEQIQIIRLSDKKPIELAKLYNVSNSSISSIRNRTSWAWLA